MALDGLYLSCLRREIAETLAGARVDKVFQPSREEAVLAFRSKTGNYKLYISVRAYAPRIHFTTVRPDNPAQPPMFCMLLRKKLTGGRFVAARQDGLERVLYLDLDCVNELGDVVRLTLAAELMGKHSNLILLTGDGKVVDALKRIDLSMSAVRPVLPGTVYTPPPALAGRLDICRTSPEHITDAALQTEKPLAAALATVTQGISPVICRELAARAAGDMDMPPAAVTSAIRERLCNGLRQLQTIAADGGQPCLLSKPDGEPLEYAPLPLLQYGTSAICSVQESFSAVLDAFYARRDAAERLRQRRAALAHLLATRRERIARKLEHQRAELLASGKREQDRIFADLITAHMHAIPRGAARAVLPNYFDPACTAVEVPLDPALSAAANAQKYYKAYRKAQTAERVLTEQIAKGESELAYLETVEDALSRAAAPAEIAALREELEAGGYLQAAQNKPGRKKPAAAIAPLRFLSDDGFLILVGRNNTENDRLTTKTARGSDIWLHVKHIPGSHVIILTDGKTPPDRTLEQAAMLAALHSKAADSRQVPVDYVPVRHVHKPAGAKPGFVIYETNRTAYVDPDPRLAAHMAAAAEHMAEPHQTSV